MKLWESKATFLKKRLALKLIVGSLIFLSLTGVLGFFALEKAGLLEKVLRNVSYVVDGVIINPPEQINLDIKFLHYQLHRHLWKYYYL